MDNYGLPHGAKGIEGDNFAIEFRGDKIVFVPKSVSAGKHYTLHVGPDSGIVDLHETTIDSDGKERHRTLFAFQSTDLPSCLSDIAPMLSGFFNLIRPLRLGWLKHRNIGIARGIDPVSDEDIAAVTTKRKRRLTVDVSRYEQNVFVPRFLEEIYNFPDGNFSLFHRGRNIGFGFKKTDSDGRVRLFWIKRRDLLRFGNRWSERVVDAISRIAIPPENYKVYPFLR